MTKNELVARRWLRLDSFYCAAAGALALSLCVPLAQLFDIPPALVAGIGVAAIFWAWLLRRYAGREQWRQPLQLVVAANAAGSAGVAVLAALTPTAAPRLLLIAVAVEVAAFAAVQFRVLQHVPRRK